MYTISFMTANYVARELGYRMTDGWGQGSAATEAAFEPIETFGERFDVLLGEIAELGFTAIDLWSGHLSPRWATSEHVAQATMLLAKYGFTVSSLGGSFGSTPDELAAACRLANGVGTGILGGIAPVLATDRAAVVRLLEEHDVRLGVENHPETTPEETLELIGDGAGGRIGTAVDTGWYATHGYDAADAIERLGAHVIHVHLKDIRAPGAHETCRYGDGVVPIERCVEALSRIGYVGGVSVEHEPDDYDPRAEIRASLQMLKGLLVGSR